jgi:hypothetical protein
MNNKLKAAAFVALYTAGMVAVIIAINLLLIYLNPTLEQMGVTFAGVLLAFAMKMMYDMRLGQLESRDRLKELNKS